MQCYKKYIGKKWIYKKNDCIAVVRQVMREVFGVHIHKIPLPDEQAKAAEVFLSEVKRPTWNKVDCADEGRVALFYNRRGEPYHVGLCVDKDHVIHCPGSPKSPGETQIDNFNDLCAPLYCAVEFYEYHAS